jgi:hypothetical protein
MPLVVADRVKETTTTTGQGTVTLLGASTGFRSFAAIGNANTTYYTIAGQTSSEWEVGIGTYTASGTTLSRDTVLSSSAGGTTKTTFSAGTKDVFVTYPATYSFGTQQTLAIANGGSGATTAQTAMNAFAGAVTSGQYLRGNGTNVLMSAIQAADVPTLNQNTTGSAATLTTARTIGGVSFNGSANINLPGVNTAGNQNTTGSAATLTTGRTIAITGDLAYTSPSFNGSGNVTAAGTLATVNSNVGSFTNASVTVNGKGLVTAVSSGTAPVTSVSGTSPVVSSGGATPAISLASGYGDTQNPYASKTANFVLAAPNGTAGVPTFRAVVAADIPTLNQNTTGSAATLTTTRTLWGQNFNGSANVTGALSSVTTLSMSGQLTNTLAIGTAPFVITSTTRVTNLNVATAGTADTLTTARTIGGVSFNGSANINLPGVNTAGNQNTSGNATTATTATNIAGGAAGRIPYNTGAGTTAFVAAGTAGQILQSNGTSAPTFVNNTAASKGYVQAMNIVFGF